MTPFEIIAVAIGGCLALEGAGWAIFPSQMRHMYQEMMQMNNLLLHRAGLVSVAIGVALITLAIR